MTDKNRKRNFWLIWSIMTVISFFALFVGVRYVLGKGVTPYNVVAYLVFSLIAGGIAAVLYRFRFIFANSCFLLGIFIGFLEMYRAFWSNLSGWEDLAGFMMLFLWIGIGLSLGALIQLGNYAYRKFRYRDREP